MSVRDTDPILRFSDVSAALGLLTRLPVPVDGDAAQVRGAAAAWAYPISGLIVALLLFALVHFLGWLTVPAPIVAGLVLFAGMMITGAMHEDGLADSADGLWGGWVPNRRLEIMKDSRIGAYGVLALGVSMLLRWTALSAAISAGYALCALIAAAMISRAAMVVVMHALPHARNGGLAHLVGRPRRTTMLVAVGIAIVASGLIAPYWTPALVLIAVLCTLACAAVAHAKIGGQTGDILGATQQVVEIACLATVATLVG